MDDADDVDGVDASGMYDRGHGRGFSLGARFPSVHCWLTVPWGRKRSAGARTPLSHDARLCTLAVGSDRNPSLAPRPRDGEGRVPAAGVSAFQSAPVERDLLKTC